MNKHLRNLIGHHRQDKGLNFGQLAELSGYKNRSKWAIRICNFEREGVGDDEMVGKVIQALEIDHQEVQEAIQKDYAIWEKWANEPVPMQMLIRITGVIILIHDMPPEVTSRESAIEYAQNYAKENALRVVSSSFKTRISMDRCGWPHAAYRKQHQACQIFHLRVWVERNSFLTIAKTHSRLLY